MPVNEEEISKILSVLSHPLRRKILLFLSEEKEVTFSDLATAFAVDTGKLSFHLRSLVAFVEQTQTGKYRLSSLGRNAIVLLRDVKSWDEEIEAAQKPFMNPLAKWTKRTGAFLIDFFITFPLFLALSNLFYPIVGQFIFYVNMPFYLVLLWGYLTMFERFRGQTLGKKVMRIKLVRTDGKAPSNDQVAIRNFGKVFLLPFDLALGLRQKDKRFLRISDRYVGTTVIDLEPKESRISQSKKE